MDASASLQDIVTRKYARRLKSKGALLNPKKGGLPNYANYCGISLTNISYKILSRLENLQLTRYLPCAKCQKLPVTRGSTHTTSSSILNLPSIARKRALYAILSEFGITAKLMQLCKLTLSNTKSSIIIGKDLSQSFDTKRSQVTSYRVTIALENNMRAGELNREDTIFYKSVQLSYTDDIDIICLPQTRRQLLFQD